MQLTEKWLSNFTPAEKIKNLIQTTYLIELGRDRFLSICPDKCSSMVWLCYNDPEKESRLIDDLICVHNYDYDGELTVEWLTNLIELLRCKKTL